MQTAFVTYCDPDNPIPFEQEDPEFGNLVSWFLKKLAKNKFRPHHPIYQIDRWSMTLGLGRNDTCACWSGKKFKKCCINT